MSETDEPSRDGEESLTTRSQRVWLAVSDTIVVFGRFRSVVAVIGTVGFAVGVAVAWRADAAVTLLAASTVLVLAALLIDSGWERIRAAGAGYELELNRATDRAVLEAAASSTSFDDFRERLERLEEQLTVAETSARLETSLSRLSHV